MLTGHRSTFNAEEEACSLSTSRRRIPSLFMFFGKRSGTVIPHKPYARLGDLMPESTTDQVYNTAQAGIPSLRVDLQPTIVAYTYTNIIDVSVQGLMR